MSQHGLTIAISKGRILKQALPLLRQANIEPLEDPDISRKLILETTRPDVRLLIVRASDVPTYVAYGAADLGIAGKDILLEQENDELYEPLDLGIAKCRLMVAGRVGEPVPMGRRLRVATKYVRSAEHYFATKGQQVEIIKLYGSMELAPLVQLSDLIVDLVDTGNTLKANGLEPRELIMDVSSRLIVNKAAWKMKFAHIKPMLETLTDAVAKISC